MKLELDGNWHKCKIDKKIYRDLCKRSDWQGIKHVGTWFFFLILSGYVAFLSWGSWWAIPTFLIYGNIFMGCNPIWHECGHRTAFRTRWLNEIFYHIGSFMYNFEPIRWRWSHFHHHSYTLHTNGPYDYEIQVTKPTDLILVFLIHIPGGNLILIFKGILSFHWETIKHALGFTTQVMKDCIPKDEIPKCRMFSRIHIIIWLAIIGFSFYFQSWLPTIFLLLPFIYGTTLRNIFDFVQHAGLANNIYDHRLCTRTVKLNPIFSFLYWHMEYHTEHHMFPMVPSYNLKKLHNILKEQMPRANNGLWDAYKQIIPALIKQAKDPSYVLKVELPK